MKLLAGVMAVLMGVGTAGAAEIGWQNQDHTVWYDGCNWTTYGVNGVSMRTLVYCGDTKTIMPGDEVEWTGANLICSMDKPGRADDIIPPTRTFPDIEIGMKADGTLVWRKRETK